MIRYTSKRNENSTADKVESQSYLEKGKNYYSPGSTRGGPFVPLCSIQREADKAHPQSSALIAVQKAEWLQGTKCRVLKGRNPDYS
jgi:hypothetical protein